MMIEEILSQLTNKSIVIHGMFQFVYLLLFTIVPAIFTMSGMTITKVFNPANWNKNRKACKYVLLDKVRDESLKNYLKRYGIFVSEMLMIVINIYVILGVTELFILFANIRMGEFGIISGAVVLISIMAGVIIIAAFIGEKNYSQLAIKVNPVIFVFCEGILIIMLVTMFGYGIIIWKILLATMSISFTISIIITLYQCGVYTIHKSPLVKISRTVRIIILIGSSLYSFVKLQICDYNIIIWSWIGLCCLEYIWIGIKDDTRVANITLHTKHGEKITREKIIQYEGKKIGYKLLDGKVEIVDDDEIDMITYQMKHLIYKDYKAKYRVECKLRDGNIIEYQSYKLICDSWVRFFIAEGGVKNAIIIKIRDAEKITEERLK